MRLYAQNTILLINSTESQMEAIRSKTPRSQSDIITDEPVSEDELARRNAAAINLKRSINLCGGRSETRREFWVISRKSSVRARSSSFRYGRKSARSSFRSPDFDASFLMSYNPNVQRGSRMRDNRKGNLRRRHISPDRKRRLNPADKSWRLNLCRRISNCFHDNAIQYKKK